jgi:hypothetical protein
MNLASRRRCTSALAASVFSSDILRSLCFFGRTEGSIPKLCSIMDRLTPTRSSADQAKTSLFLARQQRSLSSSCNVRSSLIVTVCLGVAWSRGTVLVPDRTWASEHDEAALWVAFVAGLRLMPIKRRVSLPAVRAAAKRRRL